MNNHITITGEEFSVKRYYEDSLKTGAEVLTIGYSEQNRAINVLKKGSGKIKVLFVARIHASEPATTDALLKFFKENTFDDVEAYGIFLANPDGATLYEQLWLKKPEPHWENAHVDARANSNQVDINRDWLDLSQKETRAIQKFLIELKPHFVVDHHEYYWSDKGYPPKLPTDDENGFMATMTDAPFKWIDEFVKSSSEECMYYLLKHLLKETDSIKLRHFVGEPIGDYENPIFLGIYLALRGFPKLLVETWGVGCSTYRLEKRIEFHKKAMGYVVEWLRQNKLKILSKQETEETIQFNIKECDQNRVKNFLDKLHLHKIKYDLLNGENIIIFCSSLEVGFIKTIYYLLIEKE